MALKTIRLHAKTVLPYPYNTGPDATVVGSPPQWDDESDATYAISETEAGGTSTFRSPMAALDVLPARASKIVSVSAHLRYSTAYPDGAPGSPSVGLDVLRADDLAAPSAVYERSPAVLVGGPYEFDMTDYWPNPGQDDATNEADGILLRDALLAGAVWVPSVGVITTPTFKRSSLTIYETWLDVTYEATSGVRQFPIDNARVYPPPRRGRVIGGHQ